MKSIKGKALRASRIGIFSALYTAASLIPVSVFIGASSLLSLNLIITPAIAILLTPIEAGSAALIGGLLALWIAPYQAMFGLTTMLLPFSGAFLGSLMFHKPKIGVLITVVFLLTVISAYLTARPEFPYWVAPHGLAVMLALGSLVFSSPRINIPISAFVATMCEQAAMLVQAVYVLQLPFVVFLTAFPLMIYERVLGTFGATIIVFGVSRFAPVYTKDFIGTK